MTDIDGTTTGTGPIWGSDQDRLDKLMRSTFVGENGREPNLNIKTDTNAVMLGSGESIRVEITFDTKLLEEYLLTEIVAGGINLVESDWANVLGAHVLASATKVLANELKYYRR